MPKLLHPLVLASSSPTRRQQMSTFGLPFDVLPPDVDETPLEGESAKDLVLRLSALKAQAVATQASEHLILAGDQVESVDGVIHGKPHTHEAACEQLMRCSGRVGFFYSGVCMLNSATGHSQLSVVVTEVHYRCFDRQAVQAYLKLDQPYACAGGIKLESWGYTLIRRMVSDDPNAILGLPILKVAEMFELEGISLLEHAASA